MILDNVQLFNALNQNNVSYLYHANSLTTALSLIRNGGLFSRGEIENRGLPQTDQDSDWLDRHFNVWNDIFTDTIDLHGYRYDSGYLRQNTYGPVLFVLQSDFLLNPVFNNVWITTNNPTNWDMNAEERDRYFGSVDNYIHNMHINRQQKMITIRNMNIPIPFNRYLYRIELDNPHRNIESNISAFQHAYDKLLYAVHSAGLNINIIEHQCNYCYCTQNYRDMTENEFKKYFNDYTN